MRYLLTAGVVLALALGGCQAVDEGGESPIIDVGSPAGSPLAMPPEESPSPTATDDDEQDVMGSSPSPTATDDDDDDADGSSPSPTATDGITAAGGDCEAAFADVPDLTEIESLGDLQEAIVALDATIESCESVDEWIEQAEETLEMSGIGLEAEEFLQQRCEESDVLDDTELCDELDDGFGS